MAIKALEVIAIFLIVILLVYFVYNIEIINKVYFRKSFYLFVNDVTK